MTDLVQPWRLSRVSLLLVIAGAPDEIRCDGGPCHGCHYAADEAKARWACRRAVKSDPLAAYADGFDIPDGVFYDADAVAKAALKTDDRLIAIAKHYRKPIIVGV